MPDVASVARTDERGGARGVALAGRVLDDLAAAGPGLPLREQVEAFDAVHAALADALADAEDAGGRR